MAGRKPSGRRPLNPAFRGGGNGVVLGAAAKTEDALFKGARYSGKLDLSGRSLREVPDSVFGLDSDAGADEQWWMMVETRELNLSDNALAVVPPEVGARLEQLEVLDLARNALTCLQASFFEHPLLKRLDVGLNRLSIVEPAVIRSETLVVLRLGGNALAALPPLQLPALEILDVGGNALAALPSLAGVPLLKRLLAKENRLVDPPDLSATPLIEVAELQKNALQRFPLGLRELRGLGQLNLSYNQLKGGEPVPAQLTDLSLGFNQLTELGSLRLEGAPALSVLDVRDNKLKALDEALYACK